jgi:hypothetical protein
MITVVNQLNQSVSGLVVILLNPGMNMKVALPLYATIGVLLLIVLLVAVMSVMSSPEDEAAVAASRQQKRLAREKPKTARPMSPQNRILVGLGLIAVLICVWVAAGVTTSDTRMCKSCHWAASEHAKAAAGTDPHARVDCVSCHESGGFAGRYLTGVPLRAVHLAVAAGGTGDVPEYGSVTTKSCASCHAASLWGKSTNAERGLKMSHAEPMAASATCLDCHQMRAGVVSVHNAGMTPCLRCHDGKKASSACPTCHVENAASAARARTTSFQNTQIKDISCSGCHNEKRDCDPCHGVRMPHTTEFMGGGHARAAVVDFWYNDGKVCSRCHTAKRRPCTKCHTSLIGKAHGTDGSLAKSHQGASATSCDSCHRQYAPNASRDFCKDVCHSGDAIASSPR